jgi:aspartyl-tRNA(Asn)/glutamyl-tRNA(Gln) amidotransferase subunit A
MATDDTRIAFASIAELGALLRKRAISPVEITEIFLRRIAQLNPRLNAYLTVTAERAMTDARRAEKEFLRGRRGSKNENRPLLGIPIALKDNIYTRGIRTTVGMKILKDFVPSEDATVVSRLAHAGAILLGKNNLHECAYGVTNNNVHFGAAHNPWNLSRISGGSSGGSAVAIAAGLCVGAAGTDTGGSLRIPASLCGVVGFKPTFGRASVHGVFPLAPTMDHVGPLARSVADAAIFSNAIFGHDATDPTTSRKGVEDYSSALRKPLRKFRLGRPKEYFWEKLDPEIRTITEAALKDFQKDGATITEVSLPSVAESIGFATQIAAAEGRYTHEKAGFYPSRAADYSEEVRKRIDSGGAITALQYLAALDMQKRLRAEFDGALQEVDAIVAPTVPFHAPTIGIDTTELAGEQVDVRGAMVGLNRPADLTGHPAISIPCGFTREGMPVGLQLIGRSFDEGTLLRIAFAYERRDEWKDRHPKFD